MPDLWTFKLRLELWNGSLADGTPDFVANEEGTFLSGEHDPKTAAANEFYRLGDALYAGRSRLDKAESAEALEADLIMRGWLKEDPRRESVPSFSSEPGPARYYFRYEEVDGKIERVYREPPQSNPEAAREALHGYMLWWSEEHYCATWQTNLERIMAKMDGVFGGGVNGAFSWLVEEAGGWWTYNRHWSEPGPNEIFVEGKFEELLDGS